MSPPKNPPDPHAMNSPDGDQEGHTIIHEEERTVVRGAQGQPDEVAPAQPVVPDGAALVAVSGPLAGQTVPLSLQEGGVFTLGRGAESQLVLDDGSVSRSHAQITRRGPLHSLSDLGSSNGTLVDGQLVFRDHVLNNESLIKIGIYEFVFLDPSLKAADIPNTLPVPYTPPPPPQRYEPPMPPEPIESPKASPLLAVFGVLAVIAGVVLFFGVRKISQDEGAALRTVWGNLFKTGNEAKLAYPLLEVRTAPIPGELFFQGEALGMAPQEKKLLEGVMPDTPLELRAEFKLPALDEKVTVTQMLSFQRNQEIASVLVEAPIGQVHITKLPPQTQVLLEYRLENTPPEQEAKIRQPKVDYKEPIFVPFGEYKIELRREEKFRYRRKFKVSQAEPRQVFEIHEEDLAFTPVTIISDPPEAEVYLDGVALNRKTPLRDFHLAMGSHTFMLRKTNYQDYILEGLPNPIQVNEPLSFEVKLPITTVSELIVRAKTLYDTNQWRAAESTLYQALKSSPPPTPAETAEIQYELGQAYLKGNDTKQALIYFRKAKTFADAEGKKPFFDPAKLGEARVYVQKKDRYQAMRLAVEVFFSAQDLTVKAGAEEIFHKLSPARSLVYVDSDPPGASIYLDSRKVQMRNDNGRQVPALTPMIIPEMPVGNFNLLLTKEGYVDHKETFRLGVSDLKAIKVRLQPR